MSRARPNEARTPGLQGRENKLDCKSKVYAPESLGVAKDEDTSVVNLGLDESGRVKVAVCGSISPNSRVRTRYSRLGADFEVHTSSRSLGVVDSLGTSLDIARDTVVVARRVARQVAQRVQGDRVFGRGEPKSSSIASELARVDVVRSLTTEEEAVATNDRVSGQGGLEDINNRARVETGLFPDGINEGRLAALVWEECADEVELEALGDVVLSLDLGAI